MIKFNRQSSISDVLQQCPDAVRIFTRHGLNCYECMGSDVETVEEGSIMHPEVDIEALLKDLNACCPNE